MTDKRRILCIGLDGATWHILRPRMAQGELPNLKRLCEAGATGGLESILPPETPAAWPSFMTGKNPGKHGVFDFLVYNPETRTERPVNSTLREGRTIWDYLTAADQTSLVLNVPTTYPVTPLNGAMISDFLTPPGATDYTYPPELREELEAEYGKYPHFFESMQFVVSHSKGNAERYLEELERMDRIKFEVCGKLMDRYTPDFTMLHIWGTDRLQHELWHWMDETHPAHEPHRARQFGARITAYYQMIDAWVGKLAERVGEQGITFVISDHGFGPTHYFIDLNSWLLREGFIVLEDTWAVRLKRWLFERGVTPHNALRLAHPFLRFLMLVKAPAPSSTLNKSSGALALPGMLSLDDVDWSRTRAYAPFGWSGIYINTEGIRPRGSVPPSAYEAVRDELVEKLRTLRNPHNGTLVGGPVHIKADMYAGPYTDYGPDVMPLPLEQHYMPVCFFGFASNEPVYRNTTLYGNHEMEGVLIAAGAGVRPGTVEGARLIDMAPTILHLLGRPVPDDMDGQVIEGLIDAAWLEQHPVDIQPADTLAGGSRAELSPEEEEELRNRLMGLGYL